MNTTSLSKALLIAAIGSVALIGCKKKEETPAVAPAPTTAPAPAPTLGTPAATASVVAVNLGNAVGSDHKVTTPSSTFATGDTIYAAVDTRTSDPAGSVSGKLGAKWTHVDSNQTVHEETKDLNLAGPGTTTFEISRPGGWPTGKYRVDISLDGSVVNSADFEVR